jgi:hypothetical protein
MKMAPTTAHELPKKPIKPYIPKKRAKAVTIAIGIQCMDAVILAADSQIVNFQSRALGFSWTPNCDENESEITRRCV